MCKSYLKLLHFLSFFLSFFLIFPSASFANFYVKVGGAGQIFHGLKDETIELKGENETLERKYKNTNSALLSINWGYKVNDLISVELAGGPSFMPVEYEKNKNKITTAAPEVTDYSGSRTVLMERGRRLIKVTSVSETTATDNSAIKYNASFAIVKVLFNCISVGDLFVNVKGGAGFSIVAASRDYADSTKTVNTITKEYDTGAPGVSQSDGDSSSLTQKGEKANMGLAWSVGAGIGYKISDTLSINLDYNFTHYGAHEFDADNVLRAHVIGAGIGYSL